MRYGRNKFGNKKCSFQGIEFDSQKERDYYILLLSRMQRGEITDLRLQVPFELLPAIYEDVVVHLKTKDKIVRKLVQRKVEYIADFVYNENGVQKVVDTKGGSVTKTKEYLLKKKMMRSLLGIEIIEK